MSASQKIGIAFRSYGSAHRFIKKHKLWHYVYIPGILNIVLFYFSFNWFINSVAGWVTGIFDLDCEGGLAANASRLTKLGDLLRRRSCPHIIMGDWNLTPAQLAMSGFLAAVRGHVVATTDERGTCQWSS